MRSCWWLECPQCWASDTWDQARAACQLTRSPVVIYGGTGHKPGPGPPTIFYVVGPPCQPWARRGKHLGEADSRAQLLDQVLITIGESRPLAFLMKESERLTTSQ